MNDIILHEIFTQINIVKNDINKFPPKFCIFDAINLQRHENYNSNLLAKLLDVNIEYEDTKLSFVKDFLIYLNDKFKWGYYGFKSIEELKKINHSDIRIKREEYADSRRMDLFIEYNKENDENKFAIIIENKIYASDQPSQLNDYYKSNKDIYNNNNLYIIYLTPYGDEPSENSLSLEIRNNLKDNFKKLKHSDIGEWLENILENKKYYFLHEKNILFKDNDNKYIKDYSLLKSAIVQTIYNTNMISNRGNGVNMISERLKELLSKTGILDNIKTGKDIKEYNDIFKELKIFLEIKQRDIYIKDNRDSINRFFVYLKEIKDYFESNGFNNFKKLDDDAIQENIINNGNSRCIEIIIKDGIDLILYTWFNNETNIISYIISIYTEKYQNDIKKLDEKIKSDECLSSIYGRFEHELNYIYNFYIDITSYSSKEIAEVMIKFHKLLKKNL